jgi:hypothetical protein
MTISGDFSRAAQVKVQSALGERGGIACYLSTLMQSNWTVQKAYFEKGTGS